MVKKRKIITKIGFILILTIGTCLSGCTVKNKYNQFCSIPKEGWSKIDTLFYTPQNILENKPIEIAVQLRSTATYPYKQLHILCLENLTDSTKFTKDTLSIAISNQSGNRKGKGLGFMYQNSTPYKQIKNPQISSNTQIAILPLMSDSITIGIEDLGVSIIHLDDEHVLHPDAKK